MSFFHIPLRTRETETAGMDARGMVEMVLECVRVWVGLDLDLDLE